MSSTSVYRFLRYLEYDYLYGTPQRVGQSTYGTIRSVSNQELTTIPSGDISKLIGRKVKRISAAVGLRGIAGGIILGDAVVEKSNAFITDATGQILIALTEQNFEGIAVLATGWRVFVTYSLYVEPASNVTPVLNDTVRIAENISLEIEYYDE